jgi:hypothetical protein
MLFHAALTVLLLAAPLADAFPAPGPTPVVKRDTCNEDNCLRAFQHYSSSASSFCSDYTQGVAPTTSPLPSFIPATCTAPRASSACYCLGVPTYTPAACPTGQVMHNPSFYGNPPGAENVDIEPWVISHTSGTGGCFPASGYSIAAEDSTWGDPRCVECVYGPDGGQDSISQDVAVCPGMHYTFIIHTACNTWQFRGIIGVQFRVLYNHLQIIPWTNACAPCNAENQDDCEFQPIYQELTAQVVGPSDGKATFEIQVAQAGGFTQTVLPLLLDLIFLNSAGYTGPEDNPDVS